MKNLIITYAFLLVVLGCLVIAGCGNDDNNDTGNDSDTDSDTDADTDTDSDTDSDTDTDTDSDTDTGTGGGLSIINEGPFSGEINVALDRRVRVDFSEELDTDLPDSYLNVEDTVGEHPPGVFSIESKTFYFSPAYFKPEELYTVTASADISSGDLTLGEDYVFSFTTGTTLTDGGVPMVDGGVDGGSHFMGE